MHLIPHAASARIVRTARSGATGAGAGRHALPRVLNGHARIFPEMALRLERAGWSNAEL